MEPQPEPEPAPRPGDYLELEEVTREQAVAGIEAEMRCRSEAASLQAVAGIEAEMTRRSQAASGAGASSSAEAIAAMEAEILARARRKVRLEEMGRGSDDEEGAPRMMVVHKVAGAKESSSAAAL